jgi:hypothetical protein
MDWAEGVFETIDFNNPSPMSAHQPMLNCGFSTFRDISQMAHGESANPL